MNDELRAMSDEERALAHQVKRIVGGPLVAIDHRAGPGSAEWVWKHADRLVVVCPNHPHDEPLLILYADDSTGTVRTYGPRLGPACSTEYILPDDDRFEDRASWQGSVTPVRSAGPEGDEGHTRWVLRCARPSCNLDTKIGEAQQGQLRAVVAGMCAQGVHEFTTSDPTALAAGKPPEHG
ncbi:MAG: hypothetical protein WAX29_10740 [Propionibacterium sp.]